jgi:tetratricopeptide (TPR) repeat protein
VAKYSKKRARQLKEDRFRDSAMELFDRLGDRLEGKGRAMLYGVIGVVVVGLVAIALLRWNNRKADEARQALGRAITITTAPVSTTPSATADTPSFSSEQERAQRAIDEFQKVAAKYGDPYHSEAQYFIATNLLSVDRNKGVAQLELLTKNRDPDVAALSRFALAQVKEADGKYDEAAALYTELAQQGSAAIPPDRANYRLALVYEKQDKKKEAADVLFNLVDGARKARQPDGSPEAISAAARDAGDELQRLDPARYAQLPLEAPPAELAF